MEGDVIGSITCPKCGHSFNLSEGFISHLREEAREELQKERAKQSEQLEKERTKLQEERERLRKQGEEIERQVDSMVKAEVEDLRKKLAKKAREELGSRLKDLEETLEEKDKALRASQEKELEVLKLKRDLVEQKQNLELEVARQLDTERRRIEEHAAKRLAEQSDLKFKEKDKLIGDLKKQIEEMRRKAEQGSMQTQGEVLELDLEARLQEAFPADDIAPVEKGIRGADIVQTVRSTQGRDCGRIVYETKRTKHWVDGWIAKLKGDVLRVKGNIPVIVSQALPEGITEFGSVDGVWVCNPATAVPLARVLRWNLQQIFLANLANEGREDKAEVLYGYVTSDEFRQRVETIVNTFLSMASDLEREKRAMTKLWSAREKQLESIQGNVSRIIGSFEGIAGQALPKIQALELEGGEEAAEGV